MGIKGCRSRLAARRAQQKTHKQGSAFCPRATAEGMAGSESSNVGSWPGNGGERFMDIRCELCKNKCCIYLPEVPQTERKGRKDRSKSARRAGLRILGPVQKAGMGNVHLVVQNGILAQWSSVCLSNKSCRFESDRCFHKPKCVRLQERKSTYCSAI